MEINSAVRIKNDTNIDTQLLIQGGRDDELSTMFSLNFVHIIFQQFLNSNLLRH